MTRNTKQPATAPCPPNLLKKIQAETPKGVPNKPEAESDFKKPVAWLGGRELIANLKLFALHALFGGKLDSRDWMTGVINIFKDPSKPTPDAEKAKEGEEMYTRAVEMDWTKGDAFWFDYLADTGDGQIAIYDIAYLCMTDLYLSAKRVDVHFEEQEKGLLLPRGKFLFIGGDTAYHVADYGTLAQRFQAPFWWAYRDLVCEGKMTEEEMGKRRPLFGIPANHDYYDALDGFNRQFRRPITGEDDEDERAPQLQLPTFERHQEASYVALQLPFDWWLWGIDTENDEIDFRQQKFFEKLGAPKKLILATPSPTTVFGQYLKKDSPLAEVFKCIGLRRPFLEAYEQVKSDARSEKADVLQKGECRLDLSGDIHHYARYFGPDNKLGETERPRHKQKGRTVENPNYASVVTGGGGAFFDPTNTYFGEIKEQALFPNETESRKAISKEILNFLNILGGGSVHYLGAFMAFVLCFAALAVPGTHAALFEGVNPLSGTAGLVPVVVSTLLLVLVNILFGRFRKIDERIERERDEAQRRQDPVPKWFALRRTFAVGLFVLATFVLMACGIWVLRAYRPLPPLGDSLLVFTAAAWAALMAVFYIQYTELLNSRAKRRELKRWEFWPASLMLIFAAVIVCAVLWFFGQLSAPVHLLTEVAFITIMVSVLIGLILLAALVGGGRHEWTGKSGHAFIGLWHALLQMSVPLLWTLATVHLYFSKGDRAFMTLPIPFLAYYFFRWLGVWAVGRDCRVCLVAVWLLYGLVMTVPAALYLFWLADGPPVSDVFALDVWRGFWVATAAAAVGAMMSCVWFGWYLAVAMVFNGHNNEAGGAARLVGYKQFMRIRLTKNDLTAYVIGFDKAWPDGKDLAGGDNLRLVDQFKLTVK
jgi:hypothetical protein